MTLREKLDALRVSWKAKHDEATKILANDKATTDEKTKAVTLLDERDALANDIKATEAEIKADAELKARIATGNEFMKEPVRTIPLIGSTEKKQGETEEKGGNGHLTATESEFDKRYMTGGFKTLGHFVSSAIKGDRTGRVRNTEAVKLLDSWIGMRDEAKQLILEGKAPTGMFEDSDPDGGILVPPQFSNQIYQRMVAGNNLLQRINPVPVTGKYMTFNALKENSRVDGSRYGGVQSFYVKEGDQGTASKPQWRQIKLELKKIMVLVYGTEELFADEGLSLESWLARVVPDEINFRVNDGLINGTGAGVPRGLLTSGCKITQTAISAQGANTIVFGNILDMYARVTAGQRGSLIWLTNQDTEPQLFRMFLPASTSTGAIIFQPNQPGPFTLMNRPVLTMEQCSSLGTEGDLIAFATDGYAAIIKGTVQSAMSIHLRFDFDERVFKWTFRWDGEPFDNTALTPFKGSATTSSIVTLSSTRT